MVYNQQNLEYAKFLFETNHSLFSINKWERGRERREKGRKKKKLSKN